MKWYVPEQVDHPPQDGQMAQQAWPIFAVWLSKEPAATATGRSGEGALDGEDELVGLREVCLEHTDIGHIERDRNEGLLGHGPSSCG
jgi:hypothetical protein